MEPWQPVAIMAGYVTILGIALKHSIDKYYREKFRKLKEIKKTRADRMRAKRKVRYTQRKGKYTQ